MALTQKNADKSLRVSSVNENGNEVMICSATYSVSCISLFVEIFDAAYCKEHAEEAQAAVDAFKSRLNEQLHADGYLSV